jgi:hypothetical protein
MDTTTVVMIVIAALILLVVGGFLGVAFARRQRTRRLRERFGPEYERAVSELGDQERAEEELESRLERVESLDIKPLSREQQERFVREWREVQARFVDQPVRAVQEADRLVKEVMAARGYPVSDFDQRVADISVDHPDLVTHYRGVHEIAARSEREEVDTEDLRQAMVHCRAVFEELLGTAVLETDERREIV